MKFPREAYKYLQILSLDVVLGASISGSMVATLLGVEAEMPHVWWFALPISVWVIYTTDHLLDARRLKEKAHTQRHLFHFTHFRVLSFVWAIIMLICLIWIPLVSPDRLWIFGGSMGGLTLLHLGLVKWVGNRTAWFFHKEFGVALIYSFGVWGGPILFWKGGEWEGYSLLFIQFFCIALLNLWTFSMYELEIDQKDNSTSFALAIGKKGIKACIFCLVIFVMVISGYFVVNVAFLAIQFIYLVMTVSLGTIAFHPDWFGKNERYRAFGDAVFFVPILYHIPI